MEIPDTCPFCDETVQIYNNDLRFSISIHSQSEVHIKAYQEKKRHILDFIFQNIPQKFKRYKKYMRVQDNHIVCVLCHFNITNNSDQLPDLKIIEEHLDSEMHKAASLDTLGNLLEVNVEQNSDHELQCLQENVLEEKKDLDESDLIKLFLQLQHTHKNIYMIKYIIKVNNKIYCTLCNIDLCTTSTGLTEVAFSIHSHMSGIHLENLLIEVQYLPQFQKCMMDFLEIKHQRLACNLCDHNIRTADINYTMRSIHFHFISKKHADSLSQKTNKQTPRMEQKSKHTSQKHADSLSQKTNKQTPRMEQKSKHTSQDKYCELFELDEENILSNLPVQFSSNRYYIFTTIDGRYFCQLCNISIDVNKESVLIHIKSKHHLNLIIAKGKLIFKSTLKTNDSKQKPSFENYASLEGIECSLDDKNTTTNSNFWLYETKDSKDIMVPKKIVNKDYDDLENLFGKRLPKIILLNQHFIEKFGTNYRCCLCNSKLTFHYDAVKLKKYFESHFEGPSHIKKLSEYLDL